MRILSIDPGYSSGYVIATAEHNKKGVLELDNVLKDGIFKYPNVLDIIDLAKSCDVVVMEDFVTRPNFSGQTNYSDRVIGCFEVFFYNIIVFQQPSEKPGCPDEMLRQEGLWDTSPHVRDAYRHLLIYINKQNRKKFRTVRR